MDITVSEADAYHSLRGNEDWQYFGSDAEKLTALYRASDYIRDHYRAPLDELQTALVREAVIRLAPRIDNLNSITESTKVKTRKESLDGVASEETTYFDATGTSSPFPDIDALLRDLAFHSSSNGNGFSVIRLVRWNWRARRRLWLDCWASMRLRLAW